MFPKIQSFIANKVIPGIDGIPDDRKEMLQKLTEYIKASDEPVNLTFICSHNSRRSHLSQIWAQVAATYFNLPHVHTFSGGTEVTSFNHRAVATIARTGFLISMDDNDDNNPIYHLRFSDEGDPMKCFSKLYNDDSNPTKGFAAIMTCSDAEQNCPFIPGTSARISLPYEDPKEADNTPKEKERYSERSLQIAVEMFYVFSQV